MTFHINYTTALWHWCNWTQYCNFATFPAESGVSHPSSQFWRYPQRSEELWDNSHSLWKLQHVGTKLYHCLTWAEAYVSIWIPQKHLSTRQQPNVTWAQAQTADWQKLVAQTCSRVLDCEALSLAATHVYQPQSIHRNQVLSRNPRSQVLAIQQYLQYPLLRNP